MTIITVTTAGDFRRRARAALHDEPGNHVFDALQPAPKGDHDLNAATAADFLPGPLKPAAVLVPVVARAEGLSVLFTVRTGGLSNHAGQVAFPGGRIDPDDSGPLGAALREADEEIGLDQRYVEPLGYLDAYQTGTGYRVVPVVGLVQPEFSLRLAPAEVAAVFEVPLAFLLDPANHRRDSREWRGHLRWFYAMPYGEHLIWGATAGMVRNLYERLL